MTKEQIQQLAEQKLSGYEQEHFALSRQHVIAAMVEMFEAGAAAASPQLKWIKEKIQAEIDKADADYNSLNEFGRHAIGKGTLARSTALEDVLEWLEEVPPPQAIPEQIIAWLDNELEQSKKELNTALEEQNEQRHRVMITWIAALMHVKVNSPLAALQGSANNQNTNQSKS
jgi:hypothetical protein